MELYLRIYTIRPGEFAEWLDEWPTRVVPLWRALGFEVLGAWTSAPAEDGTATFTWLLGYGEAGDIAAANAAYYASPERAALDPDPTRHIPAARELRVEPVSLV